MAKVNAFRGHSIPLGALGVFILWLGRYSFNGAAAARAEQLGSIFLADRIIKVRTGQEDFAALQDME